MGLRVRLPEPTEALMRIEATITTKPPRRWWLGLFWFLADTHADAGGEDGAAVEVRDTALGLCWTIPARNADRARYVRDQVLETAATLSGDELDEWGRTGRWATLVKA